MFGDSSYVAEIESSVAISLFVTKLWIDSAESFEHAELFEIVCYELGELLGDDLIADELIFLSDLNFERVNTHV